MGHEGVQHLEGEGWNAVQVLSRIEFVSFKLFFGCQVNPRLYLDGSQPLVSGLWDGLQHERESLNYLAKVVKMLVHPVNLLGHFLVLLTIIGHLLIASFLARLVRRRLLGNYWGMWVQVALNTQYTLPNCQPSWLYFYTWYSWKTFHLIHPTVAGWLGITGNFVVRTSSLEVSAAMNIPHADNKF